MQNRHFVRPKVAVPFTLHVNDEVAALTLPTWHQPGPFSPPRASANAPFGHGDVGSTSRANPRVPSPWHETIRQETGRASVSLWGLYKSLCNTGVPLRLPLSRLLVKLKAAPTLWRQEPTKQPPLPDDPPSCDKHPIPIKVTRVVNLVTVSPE